MKKIISFFLVCMMFSSFVTPISAENSAWREFYVSPSGNDNNPGTKEAPFATIDGARKAVRSINKQMQGDILVNIERGTYSIDKMINFEREDSGYNGYRIIYSGENPENTVLSGGKKITGFKKSEYENIYVADYDGDEIVTQISVNSSRRYMAKTSSRITGQPRPDKYNTDEWYEEHPNDIKGNLYGYYNPDTEFSCDGFYVSKKDLGIYENAEDMLYREDCYWITHYMPFEKIEQDPDVEDYLRVTMEPVFWNYYAKLRWPLSGIYLCRPYAQKPFTVMNAFELLDEPGEFYFNRKTKKLYYMPYDDEDMSTADIRVPQTSELIYFEGNDVDDKIQNITFQNIKFQDTKWDFTKGIVSTQAPSKANSEEYGRAIKARRADGLELKNNIFCSIGDTAVDFGTACTNCKITGNAFYDIGVTAILCGQQSNRKRCLGEDLVSDPVPEKYKNAPVDLLMDPDTKIYFSNYLGTGASSDAHKVMKFPGDPYMNTVPGEGYEDTLNKTYIDENYALKFPSAIKASGYLECDIWRDDISPQKGEKPYVIYEFTNSYKLSEVTLSFKADLVKEGENADFEILASNDKKFADGTYDVIATQNGAAPNEVTKYNVTSDKAYKYVMVRKLNTSPLALSRVWIGTLDRKPYVKHEMSNHLEVSNNYLERIGVDILGVAIIGFELSDCKFLHNEVKDVSYSGFSMGWSWSPTDTTCYNIETGYNSFEDTNHTGMDGAGMYTLGPQPGTRHHHNKIFEPNIADKGFYTDDGSRYLTLEDNVFELVHNTLSPYTLGIIENTYKNNYSTSDKYATLSIDKQKYWEVPKTMVYEQATAETYDTLAHAGLEDEYKYLKAFVPEGRNNLYSKYDNRYDSIIWESNGMQQSLKEVQVYLLENLLEDGKFGDGLGEYEYDCKYEIEDMLKYQKAASVTDNADWTMRYIKTREFIKDLRNRHNAYSLSETLAKCEEKLEFAKQNTAPADGTHSCDKYNKNFVDAFEKSVNEAKAKIKPDITSDKEYEILTSLENAYNTLEDNKNCPVIKAVNFPDAEYAEIDEKTNTVTVYVMPGAAAKFDNVDIVVNKNCSIARSFNGTLNLSSPVTIPVYCTTNKKYRIWTFVSKTVDYENAAKLNAENFDFASTEKSLIKNTEDGTVFTASKFTYMSNAYNHDGETNVTFNPLTKNSSNSFSVILGAEVNKDMEYKTTDSRYNRCEIEFVNGKANFYKVNNGVRALIESVDSGILWNEKNTLSYKITKINGNSYYVVSLNGKKLFSQVCVSNTKGYLMGFYTPSMNIKVYK